MLIQFSADLDWLKKQEIEIKRFNLAQEPMEFATEPKIKQFLEEQGVDKLPAFMVGEQLIFSGRYPTRDELATWFGIVTLAGQKTASSCCQPSNDSSSKCC